MAYKGVERIRVWGVYRSVVYRSVWRIRVWGVAY